MQPWSVRPETRRSLADAKALSFVPDIYVKMEERRRSPREHAFCLLYLHVACAYIHIRGVFLVAGRCAPRLGPPRVGILRYRLFILEISLPYAGTTVATGRASRAGGHRALGSSGLPTK